ncbi:MAG: hypothetical protein R3A12_05125 [Ignavibacteria bacterium]
MAVSQIYPDGKLIFDKLIITIVNTAYVFLPIAVTSTNDRGFIITGFTNYPPNFLNLIFMYLKLILPVKLL